MEGKKAKAGKAKAGCSLTDADIKSEIVTRRSLLVRTGLALGALSGSALLTASEAQAQRRRRRGSDPVGDSADDDTGRRADPVDSDGDRD